MAIFDGKLKQRLIGAVVLIILAVVFLPMILNNKGATLRDGMKPQDITVTIPLPPAQQSAPNTTLEPVQTPQIPIETAQVDTQVVTMAPQGQPSQQQTPPATNTVPPTTATNPSASKPTATGITPSWTIQLVALSSKENADKFKDKLRASHYNAYVRSEGKIHRVFVGPFIDKNETIRLQQQLQKQFNEKGIVREFKPERQ